VDAVPYGVTVTAVMDAAHSGTMSDLKPLVPLKPKDAAEAVPKRVARPDLSQVRQYTIIIQM
jgi:hypothetical protein